MKRTHLVVFSLLSLMTYAAVASPSTPAVGVNCNTGQSLNSAISKLDKNTPATVSVVGTCTEYVQVTGFSNLTIKGQKGSKLVQPSSSAGDLFNTLLMIESSKSVTVDGLNVQADTTTVPAVGIGHGSSDIRLRNMTITGGIFGIMVFEASQVSIAYVTAQDPGYASLGIYDLSDVHLEHSSFSNSSGDLWHVGVALGASHVTMYATAITNMQQGITGAGGSIVDIVNYNTYYNTGGSTDVTINNPAGTNYNGVVIDTGGSLNVSSAKLVINKAGQTWGGTTGGVLISDGAALNAGSGLLVITGSNGQGVVAMNNSHATLFGATVIMGAHGGLVAANLSSFDVGSGSSLSAVGGNSVDLFCDAGSTIVGTLNLSGAPTSQCTNLLSGETVALP